MKTFTGLEVLVVTALLIGADAFSISNICSLQPRTSFLHHNTIETSNTHNNPILHQASVSVNDMETTNAQQQTPQRENPSSPTLNNKSTTTNQHPKFDLNFLRKRTANLLHITSPEYIASESHPTTPSNDDTTTTAATTKKHKKADRRTFHWLMDSWAFSGRTEGVDQSLALLTRMESLAGTHPQLAPNERSYSKLIHAYAKSGRKDAGVKAHNILDAMLERCPTSQLAEEGEDGASSSVSPNSFLYTSVLEAYCANAPSSATAASSAEALCLEMQRLYEINPELSIRPTSRSFNAVINAWGRSAQPDSARNAEAFLDAMELSYALTCSSTTDDEQQQQELDHKPNTINYNSVLNAWANSGSESSPHQTERLLRRMQDQHRSGDDYIKPNSISFNAVIDSWAKSGAEFAGRRAEQILVSMEELYASGENLDVKPNTRSYNAVMNAYAKSRDKDAAVMAQRLLERMEELYAGGNLDVKPDFFSFATVINAWGRSEMSGKADYVLDIFRDMEGLFAEGNKSVRPNVVIFNAVINACAYTFGDNAEQNRAIEISNLMFKELEVSSYGNPDQVTYGTFLKVCNNQMPSCDTRLRVVTAIFKKCTKDGQVGKLVLDQLKSVTTEGQFQGLIGMSMEKCVDWKVLPKEWRRNVVEGRRRRKRREMF